jgi:Tol biopolymer transport system component
VTDGAVREFEWSPDGSRIAYLVAPAGKTVLLPNYSGQFVVAPAVPRPLVGDDPVESSLWIVAVEGGKPTHGADTPFGRSVTWTQPLSWSPDSTRVLQVAVDPQQKQLAVFVTDLQGKATVVYRGSDPRWIYFSEAL